jgi:polar amino acid transport system permease protein
MLETLDVMINAFPYLLGGVGVTVVAVVGGMALGLLIGVPLAVAQVYGNKALKWMASIYVWYFRGTPILVLMFMFYFGLFPLIGLNVDPLTATAVVLGLASGAYQSQIFRGSIQSLSHNQFRAASAVGMSDGQTIRLIILPQALRLSLPGWSNEYSILLKDSALAFVLGTLDIMARTHFVASRTYEHMTLYALAALLYIVLTWAGIRALQALEAKVAIRGYGTT